MFTNHVNELTLEFINESCHHDYFQHCTFDSFYSDIDFSRAYFKDCDMSNIKFVRCNFAGADFFNCNLKGVEFDGCNLYSCKFRCCKGKLFEYRTGKVLTEDLIGYKKCTSLRFGCPSRIVKLKIPRGAIVFSINGNKCRTNTAEVLDIYNVYDGGHENVAYSMFNGMSYYVGDKITINNFNCEYNIECGEGIHFFMDEKSALNYAL